MLAVASPNRSGAQIKSGKRQEIDKERSRLTKQGTTEAQRGQQPATPTVYV